MKRRVSFSLPVTVVVLAIVYIYFSTIFVFIDGWFGLMSSPGILNAVVFTAVGFMSIFSYAVAILMDAGRVPSTFMPNIEDSGNPVHEIKRKVLLVGSLTVDPQKHELNNGDSFRTIYVISGLLVVPLSVALGVLLGWHVYLILRNKTTIEFHEGVRAMWLAEKEWHVYKHPYDVGAYENLTTVLGPSISCWVCPTSGHIGSGLHFRTAYDGMSNASV